MTALLQRTVTALYAWASRRLAQFSDWLVDSAMARLGEPMEWRDVERLARERIVEEERIARELWEALIEVEESCRETTAEMAHQLAERVDREIVAMGPPRPDLRLLPKT